MFDWELPWWFWLATSALGLGGGTLALFIFVPAALPTAIAIWRWLPAWAKALIGALTFGAILYVKGRADQDAADKAARRKLEARAVAKREEVDNKVQSMTPKQKDDYLDKHGDYYD